MKDPSPGGVRYFIIFIGDFSHKTFVYFMKYRSEAFEKFKQFENLVTNQTGKSIKILRTHNGREYLSEAFLEYFQKRGTIHQLSAPYTPEQNGVAERMNLTIVEAERAMLHHANLPCSLWAEAVSTSVYLRNSTISVVTPEKHPTGFGYGTNQTLVI